MKITDAKAVVTDIDTFFGKRRRKALEIEFPAWVEPPSPCLTVSHSRIHHTPHGTILHISSLWAGESNA
jgi:hypothetical protein